MEQIDILVSSLRQFWEQLAAVLPKILVALLLLTIGWIVAKVARRGTVRLLRLLKVDLVAERCKPMF